MAKGNFGGIVRHLKSLLGAESAQRASDGELLQRFARHHDESAFAALVERYAPLVAGVCRRTLQNDHDAEDVFQATFLVLLRKAGALDGRGTVANWLYTVAYHLALKARARAGKRRAHERQVAEMPEVATPTEPLGNELRPLLDEELDRLPDKYRSPMVLCYLTGKTNEQAAQELGWTKDTVRGRLARGRELLRNRLSRRGVTLTGSTLAAALTQYGAQAAPAVWVDATLKAGALLAAGHVATGGVSASVLALVQAGLKDMFFARLKIAAALCLLVGIAGAGVGAAGLIRGEPGASATGVELKTPVADAPGSPTPSPLKQRPDDPATECSEEEMTDEMEPEGPAAEEEPELPPPPKVTIRRRNWACEGELHKQLLAVPELRLDLTGEREASQAIWNDSADGEPHPVLDLIADRPDLAGLPLRNDPDCRLDVPRAKALAKFARELRTVLGELLAPRGKPEDGVEPRLVAAALHKNLVRRKQTVEHDRSQTPIFQDPASVPALVQMLTAEDTGCRLALTEHLRGITHPAASQALARLAIFDLSPEVRAAAVAALATRRRAEYRTILIGGFRYPWAPVADHAAEALVALEDRDAVPALNELARETDSVSAPVVREVVRVNHLRSCLLCHAPSEKKEDLIRGRIPVPGQRLPPLSEYYRREDGDFVRADITYLRQDFSVSQPVLQEHGDPWPNRQRYDFLVRTRPLTPEEQASRSRQPSAAISPQREALLYALKELTAN